MQLSVPSLLLLLLASPILGAPHPQPHPHSHTDEAAQHPYTLPGAQNPLNITIHPSCNSTSAIQLHHALSDTADLLSNAISHILMHGQSSPLYTKFFGNASSAEPLGWLTRMLSAQKPGALLRCDDPDGNCAANPTTWAGHWRGSNATDETVICGLSYETRRPLEQLCARGYTVAHSPLNTFFAVDLVHRFFHLPVVAEDAVDHFADGYEEVLALAKNNATFTGRNTNTLQYFALEAYAYDVSVPGVGCSGWEDDETADNSTVVIPTSTVSAVQSIVTETATVTSSAPKDCHTHSDGFVHCD